MNQRSRAFAPNLGLGPPKGVSIDRLSGVGASAGVCLLPWPGGSAVWLQCWLCAMCAVGHIGCCVGGEYPVGVSISSSSSSPRHQNYTTPPHHRGLGLPPGAATPPIPLYPWFPQQRWSRLEWARGIGSATLRPPLRRDTVGLGQPPRTWHDDLK